MNMKAADKQNRDAALVVFLYIVISVQLLLVQMSWLPDWPGAVVALCGLFGILLVFWRSGGLRMRYLALFAGALGVAAAIGWLRT